MAVEDAYDNQTYMTYKQYAKYISSDNMYYNLMYFYQITLNLTKSHHIQCHAVLLKFSILRLVKYQFTPYILYSRGEYGTLHVLVQFESN